MTTFYYFGTIVIRNGESSNNNTYTYMICVNFLVRVKGKIYTMPVLIKLKDISSFMRPRKRDILTLVYT